MKMLELEQEVRHYRYEGRPVTLRILYPSQPYGAWPGTPVTIREWTYSPKETEAYRSCTREEIINFETALSELVLIGFTQHPTLGLVAIEGL